MALNGRTTTLRWNIGLLISTLQIPERFLPQSTRLMPRRAAPVARAYQRRLGWWPRREPRCTITSAFSTSLRLRAFGPRDLTSDAIYRSNATVLLNAEVRYRITRKWSFAVEALNLLNRKDHDIDYAYTSRITPTSDAAFTGVFHPVEPFQVRFGLRRTF